MRKKENFETLEILLYALSMYSLVYNSLHYGCILTYIKYIYYICSLMLWEYKSYDDIKVHDMKKHILVVKKNETSHQLVSSSITFLFLFLFSHIYFFYALQIFFFLFLLFMFFYFLTTMHNACLAIASSSSSSTWDIQYSLFFYIL